jgi:alginate production protein
MINKKSFSTVALLLVVMNTPAVLSAKDHSTCYSVQLLSSKEKIPFSKHFPEGSRVMHIGGVYTVRNGCYESVKALKKDFIKLSKGFTKRAVIVSTYRFRFLNKEQSKKTTVSTKKDLVIHCPGEGCKQNQEQNVWESVSLASAQKIATQKVPKVAPLMLVSSDKKVLKKEPVATVEAKQQPVAPDMLRFYFNPFISANEGQQPIGKSRLRGNTEKLTVGLQYKHFFNPNWFFYTDARVIPYRSQHNSNTKTGLKFDLKEFYLKSDALWDNQANFLLGRKILKDQRSWYYNTSLDTLGVFNKHDLLLYELYAGTRLNSNIIIDGDTSSKYDLKDTKFLIAHMSYEYLIANTVELFGLYENSATVEDRDLKWIGFRAQGKVPTMNQNLFYWLDLAHVDGKITENNVRGDVSGVGVDVGAEYNFDNLADALAIGYAYGSGGSNMYRESHLTNNRSDYLSKHLYFRYYGSFFDPELSNIKIASLYYSHSMKTNGQTAIVALHNYQQVEASSSQYIASNYTVNPNGNSKNLGNELDLIWGAYYQYSYDWRFVLSYFLGGSAYDNVASQKDGIYGQFNFRYYW